VEEGEEEVKCCVFTRHQIAITVLGVDIMILFCWNGGHHVNINHVLLIEYFCLVTTHITIALYHLDHTGGCFDPNTKMIHIPVLPKCCSML
jgi:hypothetical protein